MNRKKERFCVKGYEKIRVVISPIKYLLEKQNQRQIFSISKLFISIAKHTIDEIRDIIFHFFL